ncbi:MAG: serine/threonine protein phosphatase, partial [Planctomycetes bacterium]|nr:serine/threonine protein phosphatase [Planctomycetota bacterium]
MASKWFNRKSPDVEPNLQEFTAYFLMPLAADGRITYLEETPLDSAVFIYGLDVLMDRNAEATGGSLKEAIRAAMGDPSLADNWDPQEAWSSINRQSRSMTESQYWHVRVWLEAEARRLGRSFDAGARPRRFAASPDTSHVTASIMQWITAVADEESPPEAAAEADAPTASRDTSSSGASVAGPEGAATSEAQCPASGPAELEHIVCDLPQETIERLVREVLREAELEGPCSARADEIIAGMERLLAADDLPGLAFDEFRSGPANQAVVVDHLPPNADLWFIGDIHGDVLALRAALEYLDAVSRNDLRQPHVVLLGDVFDRGAMGYQAVLQVFHELLVRGRQFCVLTGNHDEALDYRDDEDTFVASVSPFELAEWLNDHRGDVTRRLGRAVVQLFATAPRALLLPDGLLAAHGGVPLRDLAETFTCADDLDSPACLQDFVWTRAHPRARFKYVNRNSRTCEFGYEDFEFFCERAGQVLDRPVQRMVRGHDHVEHRFMLY